MSPYDNIRELQSKMSRDKSFPTFSSRLMRDLPPRMWHRPRRILYAHEILWDFHNFPLESLHLNNFSRIHHYPQLYLHLHKRYVNSLSLWLSTPLQSLFRWYFSVSSAFAARPRCLTYLAPPKKILQCKPDIQTNFQKIENFLWCAVTKFSNQVIFLENRNFHH